MVCKSKVSICLTTFNRSYLLERSLKNVLSQSYSNFELFVVDDCSDVGQRSEIRKIERNLKDDRVTFIFNEVNQGLAANRNMVVALSTGEYFTFKDDDDEWDADYLLKMARLMKASSPTAGVVVTGYQNKDTQIDYCYPKQSLSMYGCFVCGYTPPVGGQFYKIELVRSVGGYGDVKSGVDHDLWVNIVSEEPDAIVLFNPLSLVIPDSFTLPGSEKMTTNFVKRVAGINSSLLHWKDKLVDRLGEGFYVHFSKEYKTYLCHRFLTQSIKQRDVGMLVNVFRSKALLPYLFPALIYILKQFVSKRIKNRFELTPLFRMYKEK